MYPVIQKLYTVIVFDVKVTVHLDKFLKLNQLDALISQISASSWFYYKNCHCYQETLRTSMRNSTLLADKVTTLRIRRPGNLEYVCDCKGFCYLFDSMQAVCGARPISYPMGTEFRNPR